jgi:CheY-specific phosphatase CheX
MPPTEPSRALSCSLQQVLETMCFTQASPVSEVPLQGSLIRTSVAFTGSISGFIRLQASTETADWLTASFLGQTQTSANPLSEATVSELANVICGRFLSSLDPSARLTIYPPGPDTTTLDARVVRWQTFQLDCGLLRIAYQLNSRAES